MGWHFAAMYPVAGWAFVFEQSKEFGIMVRKSNWVSYFLY
jgi:hypothetical protein